MGGLFSPQPLSAGALPIPQDRGQLPAGPGGVFPGHLQQQDLPQCRLICCPGSVPGELVLLTPPSALRTRWPSAGLAGMNLWQWPRLSPFQTGVVTHLPAPVGSRLPTPLPWHLSWQGACWAGPHCRVRLFPHELFGWSLQVFLLALARRPTPLVLSVP